MAVKNHAEDGDASGHNKDLRSLLMAFSCSGHSLVRPAPRAFFRPDRKSRRRRAQGLSRLAASSRPPEGLGLDWPEHGGMRIRSGLEAAGFCARTGQSFWPAGLAPTPTNQNVRRKSIEY